MNFSTTLDEPFRGNQTFSALFLSIIAAIMKLIGIEEHFITQEIKDAWHAARLAVNDPSVAFHAGATERRLMEIAEERLALMDEAGLDIQVLSLTTPALRQLGPDGVNLAQCIK